MELYKKYDIVKIKSLRLNTIINVYSCVMFGIIYENMGRKKRIGIVLLCFILEFEWSKKKSYYEE